MEFKKQNKQAKTFTFQSLRNDRAFSSYIEQFIKKTLPQDNYMLIGRKEYSIIYWTNQKEHK